MKISKNLLSLKVRVILSFALMLSIMMFFSIFRSNQLNNVMDRYNEALNVITNRQETIANIGTQINRVIMSNVTLAYGIMPKEIHMQNILEAKNYTLDEIIAYITKINKDDLFSEEEKAARIALASHIKYVFTYEFMPVSIELHKNNIAYADYIYSILNTGQYLMGFVWEMRDETFRFANYIRERMYIYDEIDENIFQIATVLGFLTAILLSVWLYNSINNPIKRLRNSLSEISNGNLEHEISTGYKDEFGKISDEIAQMIKKIQKISKEAEIAKEISIAKSLLIANTSHEIRTPMNSILGYSELALLEEGLNTSTKKYLSLIVENSKWLLNIINDIIDISKIESQNIKIDKVKFEIKDVLSHCYSLLHAQAKAKNIDLITTSNLEENIVILGDYTKITQIFINIMSNAIKFTEKGYVRVDVITKEIREKAVTLLFKFEDTGIGLSKEESKKIFEPFIQADLSISKKYGGTGLGLAISQKFVEAMGGEIKVNSKIGEGSLFTFELTFEILKCSELPKKEAPKEAIMPKFLDGKVLIVEDNEMNRGVISGHLRLVNLSFDIAEDGLQAIKMLEKNTYDIIFMDIHMPNMDGIETTKRVREMGINTKIIAMTATQSGEANEKYIEAGMQGYISKPYTKENLWSFLESHYNSIPEIKEVEPDLINLFIKSNTGISDKIEEALKHDIKEAHLLIHGLKSNAGFINETNLQKIAEEAEDELKNSNLSDKTKEKLKNELSEVFERLEFKNQETRAADKNEIKEILEKLEILLKSRNAEYLKYVPYLRSVEDKEFKILIEQIESLEEEKALEILKKIKGI